MLGSDDTRLGRDRRIERRALRQVLPYSVEEAGLVDLGIPDLEGAPVSILFRFHDRPSAEMRGAKLHGRRSAVKTGPGSAPIHVAEALQPLQDLGIRLVDDVEVRRRPVVARYAPERTLPEVFFGERLGENAPRQLVRDGLSD